MPNSIYRIELNRISTLNRYSSFRNEIRNISFSYQFKMFINILIPRYDIFHIIDDAQSSLSKEFSIYFFLKYTSLRLFLLNESHYSILYNKEYYDSLSPMGVHSPSDLHIFRINNVSDIPSREILISDIEEKYLLAAKEVKTLNR